MVELLFLPALLGYGEAAVAFAGDARHPGRAAGAWGVWGVRIGWLAQTALIAVQASSSGGFPWETWAGSLNLFVWLLVGAYLVVFCFLLVYVLVIASKLSRLERDVEELTRLAGEQEKERRGG